MPEPAWLVLAVWMAGINLVIFTLFGWDKACAVRNASRIPEQTLLLCAVLGGTPGAKAAQLVFRHKTRKEPFRTRLNAILVVQVLGLGLLAVPAVREAAAGLLLGG